MGARAKVRFLFLAVAAISLGQFFLTRYFGEPYPAIMMPAFGSTGGPSKFRGAGGGIKWSFKPSVVFFSAAGDERTVSWKRVLGAIPSSHSGTLSVLLQQPLGTAGDSPGERAFYAIFPGYHYSARNLPDARSLGEWLARRAETLEPGLSFTSAEIRWQRVPGEIVGRMKLAFAENQTHEAH